MERTERSRKELLEFVLSQFALFEVAIRSGSRWWRIKSLYEANDGVPILRSNPDYDIAVEAERDLQVMAFIFDNIGDLKTDPEFLVQLQKCVSDSSLPQEDSDQSDGRNAQFHLLNIAICKKAGMSPCFAEPDIICDVGGRNFGIAVKRIKNLNKLEKRVSAARDQIKRCGFPGIIAVEVTLAVNPKNERPTLVVSDHSFMAACHDALTDFVTTKIDKYRDKLRGTEVRGIVLDVSFIAHSPALNGEPVYLNMTYGICTVENNRRRSMEFHKFKNAFDKGLYRPQSKPHPVPERLRWRTG